ncbi:peptidoglycan DD-metalloendopeptidase family protein [soil metagenome]
MTALAWFRRIALAGFVLSGIAHQPAQAVESDAAGDLDLVQRQLDASKSRQDAINARREAILRESTAISQKLIGVAEKMQAREADIAAAEERIARLDSDRIKIKADLSKRRVAISRLLAGLQRIEQNPPPALMVAPHDVLSALRGAMLFGTIVPEMKHDAENLSEQLGRLESLQRETRQEQDRIKDYVARLESSRSEMTELQARKVALMAETDDQLAAERQRSRDLAAKAKDLKQLLDSLAAERKIADARAAADADKAKRQQEARAKMPKIAFGDARGRLEFPAQGRILKAYGAEDGFGGKTRGVFVATRAAAQVIAPADGEVEFAGLFRSYGQLLILNTGGGYHVLLAGMGEITALQGQFLKAGEPVGVMGSTAAPGTLTGDQVQDGKPVLYIEFRKQGEAIDSSPWWVGGFAQARG